MAISLKVDPRTLRRISEKLGGWGHEPIWDDVLKEAMEDLLNDMERAARIKAKPHLVDTGTTARFIESEISSTKPLQGRLFTNQKGALAIDQGRKPGGRMPPEKPIADWMRRHKVDAPVFLIRRSIARKGTKGLHFMEAAAKEAEKSIKKYADKAMFEIQRSWRT